MKKLFMTFLYSLLVITCVVQFVPLKAYVKKTYSYKPKNYTPKAPYAGFGQRSSANGRPKTRTTHGYFKPSNGYKFVNPYARSK